MRERISWHGTVKGVPCRFANQGDTRLVALPLGIPIAGVDVQFACGLDVASRVTDTEIDPCLGVAAPYGSLSYECACSHVVGRF